MLNSVQSGSRAGSMPNKIVRIEDHPDLREMAAMPLEHDIRLPSRTIHISMDKADRDGNPMAELVTRTGYVVRVVLQIRDKKPKDQLYRVVSGRPRSDAGSAVIDDKSTFTYAGVEPLRRGLVILLKQLCGVAAGPESVILESGNGHGSDAEI